MTGYGQSRRGWLAPALLMIVELDLPPPLAAVFGIPPLQQRADLARCQSRPPQVFGPRHDRLVFDQQRHRYQQRRRMRKAHAARPLESWLDLSAGDFVVHVIHGIARFRGMRTMRKGESAKSEEYLTLEFAERAGAARPGRTAAAGRPRSAAPPRDQMPAEQQRP